MTFTFSKAAACLTGLAIGATSLLVAQPSQAAFPNKDFGCSVPEANNLPGSPPNALIASPSSIIPGLPTSMTVGVFDSLNPTGSGVVQNGSTRCFQAMRNLNALRGNTALMSQTAVTFEPTVDAQGRVTSANVCLVPLALAGIQNCGFLQAVNVSNPAANAFLNNGQSYLLLRLQCR